MQVGDMNACPGNDCSKGTLVPASTISVIPNYTILSINPRAITTTTDQATAIANIRQELDNNQGVYLEFFFPNLTAWNNFTSFWDNQNESVVWAGVDQYSGAVYDPSSSMGHAVLVVGYNYSAADLPDSYWVLLNSWGTTTKRPNGLFRMKMDMNYSSAFADGSFTTEWWTYDIAFFNNTGPSAGFAANITTGTAPLAVQFTDASNCLNPTSWNWTFGDGTFSTTQNPVHVYTIPGTYAVSLAISNASGTNTTTKASYISVLQPPVPATLPFSANVTSGGYNLTVQFTDLSPGTPLFWNWSFGDGSFSTLQDPVHTYSQTDDTRRWYDVGLNVTNTSGYNSTLQPDYIHIMSFSEYYRSISGNPGNIDTPTFVQTIEDWRLQRPIASFTVSPGTSVFVGLIEDWRLQRHLA
jgi:PKD repeat protein